MRSNVAIIGCGQLGRRHIQGLGLSSFEINVHVYDTSKDSLKTCARFAEEITDDIRNLQLSYFDNIQTLAAASSSFDLVIVSSTATGRPSQIKILKSLLQSASWLLEKPICQSPDEIDELLKLTNDMVIWVNHFRRLIPCYQTLKSDYFYGQSMDVTFSGREVGIGCNISHFIDFMNYMTGAIPVKADISGLSKRWHVSKRLGFKEINGEIKLQFSDGSSMRVISDEKLSGFMISGVFKRSGKKFLIDEDKGIAVHDEELIEIGKIPFQSELTGKLFDQIKQQGECNLTPLFIAANCYRVVISKLLEHWKSTTEGQNDSKVPLT